jgi:hypothetical protein
MADTLTISIPAPLADEVRAAAEARGLSPEDYVRQQLEADLEFDKEMESLDWEEDIRRLEEAGENIPLDQAFDELRGKVAEARAQFKNK